MQDEDRLFAEVAHKLRLVKRDDLISALQQAGHAGLSVREYLVQRGSLTTAQASQITAKLAELMARTQKAGPSNPARVAEAAGHGPSITEMRPSKERHSMAGHRELAPGEPYLHKVLAFAMKQRASDLHVHAGNEMMLRINGTLQPVKAGQKVSAPDAEKLIAQIVTGDAWHQLTKKGQLDFAYHVNDLGRFRVNAYRQERGYDIVFRLIPERVPTLSDLGLPEDFSRFIDFRTGMVLCTGPVGCGKTTTLAALLSKVVEARAEHVITLENPIEFVLPKGKALVNQRQVGIHTESFARALRGALREDPDVIAITELRDRESISLALSAAETGHLVMGTLHTGNAGQTINRIVNAFPPNEQTQVRSMLSESLRVVISQRLIPRRDGHGRACAYEVLICTPAVANLIREDKTTQLPSVMQTGKSQGMITLDDSLFGLLKQGVIDHDQARRFAVDRARFAAPSNGVPTKSINAGAKRHG